MLSNQGTQGWSFRPQVICDSGVQGLGSLTVEGSGFKGLRMLGSRVEGLGFSFDGEGTCLPESFIQTGLSGDVGKGLTEFWMCGAPGFDL